MEFYSAKKIMRFLYDQVSIISKMRALITKYKSINVIYHVIQIHMTSSVYAQMLLTFPTCHHDKSIKKENSSTNKSYIWQTHIQYYPRWRNNESNHIKIWNKKGLSILFSPFNIGLIALPRAIRGGD